MTVEYRLMREEEVSAVIHFWSQYSDTSVAHQTARFESDPAARAHTYVAVFPDGAIGSTIHYHVSSRWDAIGHPRLVGEIDSVFTRPDARRQGHAQQLLLLVLGALEREGCDWSLLVSTEMGRSLYERNGWRCYPEPWRRGTVTEPIPLAHLPYHIRPYDPIHTQDGWARISTVDIAYNALRPLTVVRDSIYWQRYAAQRVGNWIIDEGLVIYAAFRSEADLQPCGYATAEFNPAAGFQIRDMGVMPADTAAIPGLLNAVAREARLRHVPPVGRMFLPREPAMDAALAEMFGATLEYGQNLGHLMARTIGSRCTDQQLDELFDTPGAFFSCIDCF